jgi:hypothetical protein
VGIGLGALLEERYPLPEWALIFELNMGTGWRGQDGRADAVAFNCYPSKGYHRLAFEMKTGRGDFLKELDTPQKRAWLEENFHQTYFVCTPGVAKEEEVPDGWGLLVETKKGDNLRRVKVARHRELPPLPETLALSAIRSMAGRMHSFTIPFKFEGRTVTREDIDRYVHETLALQQQTLLDQIDAANKRRRELDKLKEQLVEPFLILARAADPEGRLGWMENQKLRDNPGKYLTRERVQAWVEQTPRAELGRRLKEAREAHAALGKLLAQVDG